MHLHIKTRPSITWFIDIMRQTLKCTQRRRSFQSYIIKCPSKCLLGCLLGIFTMYIIAQQTQENFLCEQQKLMAGGKNAHN